MEDSVLDEIMDIHKLKVPDLKRELKLRGFSTTGNKNELIERLQTALKMKVDDTASAASVDDLDDDLLNDDDLDHEPIDGSESVLADIDAQLGVTPIKSLQKQTPFDDLTAKNQSEEKPKKIVLKRNSSALDESLVDQSTEVEKSKAQEKKILKLSELTPKERLELRAKKFGAPLSDDAKKVARSERFGISTTTDISKTNEPVSLDVLKKRADRFGTSVSTVMSKLAQEERLEKRKERFGIITSVNGSVAQSEKAKQRLERFKTPVA